jgi:hypothetical protein
VVQEAVGIYCLQSFSLELATACLLCRHQARVAKTLTVSQCLSQQSSGELKRRDPLLGSLREETSGEGRPQAEQ